MTKNYSIDLREDFKLIHDIPQNFGGTDDKGNSISFSNYFMKYNNKPFFGICGEFHFSRCDKDRWEDEILKMKMCKINIIATYIIWIFHEEENGIFDWSGNKNLRRFLELCKKHDMFAIIRIGPFAHAEARNGGIPDWMFGRPFHVRSNDEEYLKYATRFYEQISMQVSGLLFKDGGPVIATQIENEYMHAGAPQEITTGLKLEWVSSGRDGEAHMKKLKEIAFNLGIQTPFYTCTAWGNAAAPIDEMLPLWGGYAFWPWIFTGDETDSVFSHHPATRAYIYYDYHNNSMPCDINSSTLFHPEDLPYSCCEMGGGMLVFYKYRFILPPASVEAMCNVKVAGGCNFIGYYMFRGGSNPSGKTTPFLNEHNTPKISYDFQAALGEFGQIRPHYKMLKRLHIFFESFSDLLCPMKTVLPWDTNNDDQHDTEKLRFCARVKDGSGFVFINTYQDHVETKDQNDFSISLQLKDQNLCIPESGSLFVKKDVSCILPFNINLGKTLLKYSSCQLITFMEYENQLYYFFYTPDNLKGEYCFDSNSLNHVRPGNLENKQNASTSFIYVPSDKMSLFSVVDLDGSIINICTLTNIQSLDLWKTAFKDKERIIISDSDLISLNHKIYLDSTNKNNTFLSIFPGLESPINVSGGEILNTDVEDISKDIFESYNLSINKKSIECRCHHPMIDKAVMEFKPEDFEDIDELILQIRYVGDIGYIFIDGVLIADNFSNSDVWETGLMQHKDALIEHGLYIHLSPIKKGTRVKRDNMAAMREEVESVEVGFLSVELIPRHRLEII